METALGFQIYFLVCYTLYLVIDSYDDKESIKKYGNVPHMGSWALKALITVSSLYLLFGFTLKALVACFIMATYTSIVFDALMGLHLGLGPLYVGRTASVDKLLRWLCDDNLGRIMALKLGVFATLCFLISIA